MRRLALVAVLVAGCGSSSDFHSAQEVRRAFAAHGERLAGQILDPSSKDSPGMVALFGPFQGGESEGFFVEVLESDDAVDRVVAERRPKTLRYLHRDNVLVAYVPALPEAQIERCRAALDDLPLALC